MHLKTLPTSPPPALSFGSRWHRDLVGKSLLKPKEMKALVDKYNIYLGLSSFGPFSCHCVVIWWWWWLA